MPEPHETFVTVECILRRLTNRAALLEIDGEEIWCPLQAIDDVLGTSQIGKTILVDVAGWKARQWGIEC